MRKILLLAILTLLLTYSNSAYAFSIDTSGNITPTLGNTNPYYTVFNATDHGAFSNGSHAYSDFSYTSVTNVNNGFVYPEVLSFNPSFTPTYPITIVETNSDIPSPSCWDNAEPDIQSVCESHLSYVDTQTWSPTVSNNATWRGNNGFWGSTTPISIVGDMTASVQNTGSSIWPLFKVVGIPIALILALALVNFMWQALYMPKNKKASEIVNSNGENFIYHSANDLEFKRDNGQVKRKRGRPRKTIL